MQGQRYMPYPIRRDPSQSYPTSILGTRLISSLPPPSNIAMGLMQTPYAAASSLFAASGPRAGLSATQRSGPLAHSRAGPSTTPHTGLLPLPRAGLLPTPHAATLRPGPLPIPHTGLSGAAPHMGLRPGQTVGLSHLARSGETQSIGTSTRAQAPGRRSTGTKNTAYLGGHKGNPVAKPKKTKGGSKSTKRPTADVQHDSIIEATEPIIGPQDNSSGDIQHSIDVDLVDTDIKPVSPVVDKSQGNLFYITLLYVTERDRVFVEDSTYAVRDLNGQVYWVIDDGPESGHHSRDNAGGSQSLDGRVKYIDIDALDESQNPFIGNTMGTYSRDEKPEVADFKYEVKSEDYHNYRAEPDKGTLDPQSEVDIKTEDHDDIPDDISEISMAESELFENPPKQKEGPEQLADDGRSLALLRGVAYSQVQQAVLGKHPQLHYLSTSHLSINSPVMIPHERSVGLWRLIQTSKLGLHLNRIMSMAYEAIREGFTLRARQIWYKEPKLFEKPENVSEAVNLVCTTLGVGRPQLNITSAPDAVWWGSCLRWTDPSGRTWTGSDTIEQCVPDETQLVDMQVDLGGDRRFFAIIAESHAVAPDIVEMLTEYKKKLGNGIAVAVRGWSSVRGRRFLNKAQEIVPDGLFVMVVDHNPGGIAIYYQLLAGHLRTLHLNVKLTVRNLVFLGLKAEDTGGIPDCAFGQLGPKEVVMAQNMLSAPYLPEECKLELQHMIRSNRRLELEQVPPARVKRIIYNGIRREMHIRAHRAPIPTPIHFYARPPLHPPITSDKDSEIIFPLMTIDALGDVTVIKFLERPDEKIRIAFAAHESYIDVCIPVRSEWIRYLRSEIDQLLAEGDDHVVSLARSLQMLKQVTQDCASRKKFENIGLLFQHLTRMSKATKICDAPNNMDSSCMDMARASYVISSLNIRAFTLVARAKRANQAG
ncbi:unnamed protein product [Rhizoctonia solani]|uniref:DNA topoisomerase (ATP-hydrolyzing) n=1 Tax=Rhizoctonia solani TaxID=456999 RepID=A0A8H3GTI1_9AGAM|nr:unnamed protein product [Rhizoctonia solani]